MTEPFYPPVVHHFAVSIGGDPASSQIDGYFHVMSGAEQALGDMSDFQDGERWLVHRLPRGARPTNLILQRGRAAPGSPLVEWARNTLDGGLNAPIQPHTLVVRHVDPGGKAGGTWTFTNAWPVRWEVADTGEQEVVITSLELAYSSVVRDV